METFSQQEKFQILNLVLAVAITESRGYEDDEEILTVEEWNEFYEKAEELYKEYGPVFSVGLTEDQEQIQVNLELEKVKKVL